MLNGEVKHRVFLIRLYSLRPATAKDLGWLLNLRKETMTEHLLNSGMSIEDEELKRRILYNFEDTKIIIQNDNQIGMIKVKEDKEFFELIQIQISPKYQGKGIGKCVIEDLITEAQKKSLPIFLSVLKTNPAKSLYEALGFEVYDEDDKSIKMKRA